MSTPTPDPTAGEGLSEAADADASDASTLRDVRAWLRKHRPDRPGGTGLSAQAWMDLQSLIAARESAAVTRARAEALQEAADALNTTDHATETALVGIDHAIDWLRVRAESLAPDAAGEPA